MKTKKRNLVTGKVFAVHALCGGWAKIEIEAPEIATAAAPGQFVQARAWGGVSPLLRRPFSIAGVSGGIISLLLKVVGRGTELIASAAPGDGVELIGPLGEGFPKPGGGVSVWLVAGGTGIAPFLYMMSAWPDRNFRLFYGARSAADCGAVGMLPPETVLATESGDGGMRGLVTEALGFALAEKGRNPEIIFSCGPVAMMSHVHRLAVEKSIPCFVSLEAFMGCGFGACLGCAVPGADKPYYHVCDEGPVFNSLVIDWKRF